MWESLSSSRAVISTVIAVYQKMRTHTKHISCWPLPLPLPLPLQPPITGEHHKNIRETAHTFVCITFVHLHHANCQSWLCYTLQSWETSTTTTTNTTAATIINLIVVCFVLFAWKASFLKSPSLTIYSTQCVYYTPNTYQSALGRMNISLFS